METLTVPPDCPLTGRPLLELDLIRKTGVQIGGIRRGRERRIRRVAAINSGRATPCWCSARTRRSRSSPRCFRRRPLNHQARPIPRQKTDAPGWWFLWRSAAVREASAAARQ